VRNVLNFGSLNLLETSGSDQVCTGIALHFSMHTDISFEFCDPQQSRQEGLCEVHRAELFSVFYVSEYFNI
jgi:hypothetical protein